MDRIQSGQEWPHKLLTWFDQNRRDLPWREGRPRNPIMCGVGNHASADADRSSETVL